MYDVIIAGQFCLDIIPLFPDTGLRKIEELMRPGKLVNVRKACVLDGISGIKDWDATAQMIQTGRPFIEVHLTAADGWIHNTDHNI